MVRKPKHLIRFMPNNITVQVSEGTDILEAARLAHVPIATSCGGQRDCGECRIIILEGIISEVTPEELERLSASQIHRRNRLACCARVLSDVKVWLPTREVTS